MSGSLFDFGVYLFHNVHLRKEMNLGGVFYYLPKLETHYEARLWNDVFVTAESYLQLPIGTIRCTVLIETIGGSLSMDEILYELKEHIVALNAGRWGIFDFFMNFWVFCEFWVFYKFYEFLRFLLILSFLSIFESFSNFWFFWVFYEFLSFFDKTWFFWNLDYIFSLIKKFKNYPGSVLPERGQVTMTVPFMHAYTERLIHICHKRGAHAIGGMSAFIPSKTDKAANESAMRKIIDDKQREANSGNDGSWVAHPDLVGTARSVFEKHLQGKDHQKDVMRNDVKVTDCDLTNLVVPGGFWIFCVFCEIFWFF